MYLWKKEAVFPLKYYQCKQKNVCSLTFYYICSVYTARKINYFANPRDTIKLFMIVNDVKLLLFSLQGAYNLYVGFIFTIRQEPYPKVKCRLHIAVIICISFLESQQKNQFTTLREEWLTMTQFSTFDEDNIFIFLL
jgi:hypothetical protein